MPGPSGDEPDFGFLNDDSDSAEVSPSFDFSSADQEPSSKPAASTGEPAASKGSPIPPPESSTAKPQPQQQNRKRPADRQSRRSKTERRAENSAEAQTTGRPEKETAEQTDVPAVSRAQFLALSIYAAVVSAILLLQLLGVMNLGGGHQLESLPDVAPLKPGEFQSIPETASLPPGHQLGLGSEARFGEIVFTPTKIVREPLTFEHMSTGKLADDMSSDEVLKLYFTITNVSESTAFPPWDVSLMSHRSPPEGLDESTKANSWLMIQDHEQKKRVLNFYHSPNSSFNIQGMASRVPLKPGETRTTFVASAEDVNKWIQQTSDCRWRLQLRKGLHPETDRSVTTLVDVMFSASDIQG